VHVSSEEELSKFWDLHGRHYNGVMELKSISINLILVKFSNMNLVNLIEKEVSKDLKANNKGKKEKKFKKEFSFGGEKYTEIATIKNLFKGILGRTANG
jgi:hypothetical protein